MFRKPIWLLIIICHIVGTFLIFSSFFNYFLEGNVHLFKNIPFTYLYQLHIPDFRSA